MPSGDQVLVLCSFFVACRSFLFVFSTYETTHEKTVTYVANYTALERTAEGSLTSPAARVNDVRTASEIVDDQNYENIDVI